VSITRSGDISSGQSTLLVMTANAEVAAQDGAAERPLRRDAERNRQRILAAAAEVFSECGLDATLDEVARAAGVGVGTVYRRFPDKESLVQELFRGRIDGLVAVAEHSCTAADPWQGLVSYLEFAVSAMAADLGLRQMMTFATYGRDHVCYARERMRPVISRLVQRAQASGDLRDDLESTDVKLIVFMLASVAEYAATVRPDIWRRYLALLLDGLRPSRETAAELPVPAPDPLEIEAVMRAHGHRSGPRR
jgi:AcrR family transcriptional regulator